jgi:hypothetical protein
MLDRQEVRSDVGHIVRDVVIRKTLFDESDYDPEAIPAEPPMNGWDASPANWLLILGHIQGAVHAMKPEYQVLAISEDDATQTRTAPLFITSELLTDLIMAGNRMAARSPKARLRRRAATKRGPAAAGRRKSAARKRRASNV